MSLWGIGTPPAGANLARTSHSRRRANWRSAPAAVLLYCTCRSRRAASATARAASSRAGSISSVLRESSTVSGDTYAFQPCATSGVTPQPEPTLGLGRVLAPHDVGGTERGQGKLDPRPQQGVGHAAGGLPGQDLEIEPGEGWLQRRAAVQPPVGQVGHRDLDPRELHGLLCHDPDEGRIQHHLGPLRGRRRAGRALVAGVQPQPGGDPQPLLGVAQQGLALLSPVEQEAGHAAADQHDQPSSGAQGERSSALQRDADPQQQATDHAAGDEE